MHTPRVLTGLVLVAFLLTGCMRLDMDVTIDGETDTMSGSFITAIDKEVLTENGKKPVEEGFAGFQKDLKDVPTGQRVEVYDDGKYYGRKTIFDRHPLADFKYIRHEGDLYIFEADGSVPVGNISPIWSAALQYIDISIIITFPGKVIEHDAKSTLRGERTVVWKMKLPDFKKVRAVAEQGSDFPWMLLVLVAGIFGALAIAGLVIVAIRFNRRPPPEVAI